MSYDFHCCEDNPVIGLLLALALGVMLAIRYGVLWFQDWWFWYPLRKMGAEDGQES